MRSLPRLLLLCCSALLALAGCSRKCPQGTFRAHGRCVGSPAAAQRLGPRTPHAKPLEMPKRAPLVAPELKPLAAIAPAILGGAAPRWFESADEVRKQAGLTDKFITNVAWNVGPVYSLSATPLVAGQRAQVDYFFLGDNLVGYGIRFFVDEGPSEKLHQDLLGQARAAYGPPKAAAPGNLDFAKGQIVAHFSLNDSPAMVKVRKRPVKLLTAHFTIPPALRDATAAKGQPAGPAAPGHSPEPGHAP